MSRKHGGRVSNLPQTDKHSRKVNSKKKYIFLLFLVRRFVSLHGKVLQRAALPVRWRRRCGRVWSLAPTAPTRLCTSGTAGSVSRTHKQLRNRFLTTDRHDESLITIRSDDCDQNRSINNGIQIDAHYLLSVVMQTLLNPVQSLGSSQGMSRHTESIVAVYQQQGDAIPQDG